MSEHSEKANQQNDSDDLVRRIKYLVKQMANEKPEKAMRVLVDTLRANVDDGDQVMEGVIELAESVRDAMVAYEQPQPEAMATPPIHETIRKCNNDARDAFARLLFSLQFGKDYQPHLETVLECFDIVHRCSETLRILNCEKMHQAEVDKLRETISATEHFNRATEAKFYPRLASAIRFCLLEAESMDVEETIKTIKTLDNYCDSDVLGVQLSLTHIGSVILGKAIERFGSEAMKSVEADRGPRAVPYAELREQASGILDDIEGK